MASMAAWWRWQGMQEHYRVLVGWSRHGRGCARECVCTQRPETTLAYALPVWSAMAKTAKSSGEQGKDRGSPLVSWEIGWRCSGGLRPCSPESSAVPTPDRDEDDGAAFGSGDFGKLFPLVAASASPPFFLFSLFSLG